MADFFRGGRRSDTSVGGVFNGTDVSVSLGSGSGGSGGLAGALVQSIQLTYQRQINRVLELGSEKTYYIIGRSQGNAALQNIVGPSSAVDSIVDSLADACDSAVSKTLSLSATQDFCASSVGASSRGVKYTLTGPILTQIGVQLGVQDFTIVQSATIEFVSLSKG